MISEKNINLVGRTRGGNNTVKENRFGRDKVKKLVCILHIIAFLYSHVIYMHPHYQCIISD